jgi:hypothetical protein
MPNVDEAKPLDDLDDLLGCCGLAADDLPPVPPEPRRSEIASPMVSSGVMSRDH